MIIVTNLVYFSFLLFHASEQHGKVANQVLFLKNSARIYRIYRPSFRENWVYKFGHRIRHRID
jgi:hypothetical protein